MGWAGQVANIGRQCAPGATVDGHPVGRGAGFGQGSAGQHWCGAPRLSRPAYGGAGLAPGQSNLYTKQLCRPALLAGSLPPCPPVGPPPAVGPALPPSDSSEVIVARCRNGAPVATMGRSNQRPSG